MKVKDRIEFKNKAPVLTFSANNKVIEDVLMMVFFAVVEV